MVFKKVKRQSKCHHHTKLVSITSFSAALISAIAFESFAFNPHNIELHEINCSCYLREVKYSRKLFRQNSKKAFLSRTVDGAKSYFPRALPLWGKSSPTIVHKSSFSARSAGLLGRPGAPRGTKRLFIVVSRRFLRRPPGGVTPICPFKELKSTCLWLHNGRDTTIPPK